MEPLLRITGLTRTFRSRAVCVQALTDINLEVFPGDTLGLVGESGSGKTTLARCALALLEPDNGTVVFDGLDLFRLAPDDLRRNRRNFQIVFQDSASSLDPRMTIGRSLAEPFEAHGIGSRQERKTRVGELLDLVALDRSLAGQTPGNLSGGQQQRVGIARALALKPRLLIADEPVSALDASVQAQILNLIADLQRRLGLTLILISHSLDVVHYLCNRVAVMYRGRIVEEAPTAPFFEKPCHPYSQLLLSSTPGLSVGAGGSSLNPVRELPSPPTAPRGCAFHPRCTQALLPRCREEIPRLVARGPGSKIACFLYTGEADRAYK